MSFAARATATADRLVRHFGDGATATFRARHSLISPLEGSIVEELAVLGLHPPGAAALTLREAAGQAVQGFLIKGVEFQIAGDPTTYTVLKNTEALDDTLEDVEIGPVLQQEAADEAVVTITRGFVDTSRPCAVTKFRDDQVDNEHVLAEDRMVVISLLPGLLDAEVSGDLKVNGQRLPVKAILPLQPGDTAATLRIHVGNDR